LTAIKDRQWQIFNSSALKNVGLEEGMSWLAQTINNRKK